MDKYKLGRAISERNLHYAGFVVDTLDDNAKRKNYYLYKKLSNDSYMKMIIRKVGKRYKYNSSKDVKIYVGNLLNYGCKPEEIEKRTEIGFKPILDDYTETMETLIEGGVLTKKYKPKKRN